MKNIMKKLKRNRRKLAVTLGCAALIFCASSPAIRGDEKQPKVSLVENYLGQRVVALLKETTKIEAFRVDPKARRDWAKGPATELDKDFAAQVSRVLLDENTYRWEGGTPIGLRCIFVPAVAYRFWKDKEFVSVLVCFKCSEVAFQSDNPDDKADPFRRAIMAKLRPEIVKLTKQAFPDDKDIQALKG